MAGGLTFAVIVATVVAVPLAVLVLSGRGPARVPVSLNPPYSVEWPDGRAIAAAGPDSVGAWINFPIGEERQQFREPPALTATVNVAKTDLDTRVVMVAAGIALLALAWIAVLNLLRFSETVRSGETFAHANPNRLRLLGGSLFVVPLVLVAATQAVNRTLDLELPFTALAPGPPWWVYLVTGLGALAIGQAFSEGARLRDLETKTV